MNLFDTVKAAVTPRMAAERYGLPIQQGSMVCCPFHADRTPSMKLNENYFYCFGCGASGDVIDLAARLFSLSGYDAAKKLAADFGITGQKPSILAKLQRGKSQAETERRCFRVLGDYLQILQDWKAHCAPQSPEDAIDPRYAEACHMLERIGNMLDILAYSAPRWWPTCRRMIGSCGWRREIGRSRRTSMERNEPPRWMQDKHFNEVLFCEDFLAEYPMVCVGGSFFTVEGRVADKEGIRKQIYEVLRPHFTSGTARRATNLLETLKLEAYTPELPIQEDRIHVANGTLFLDGEFRTEKEFCRNRLPIRYDPNAPQPVIWLRFLSDLLEPDILTLQEYLGYCLIPTNRGQVMMLLKGNGGEGKSRIGVVMQKLLGGNMKNGSIAKVERSPFARADLEHELLMVDDDMKLEALKSTHYLKSLITAEMPMDLERKGEQSYQGQMYVRFLAFSNGDLESLYDHSDGFYRRQLILSVRKKPLDREDDPFLADKLCDESEGIFLWCLEGLRRLQANNFRFTESSRTKSNREDARREADNVLLFLRSEGYIRLKADSTIPSAALYAIYTMWCSDNAYKPLAARTVSMTLKKYADEFGLEHDNHIQNTLGKRVNGFWGIEALVTPLVV